MPFRASMLALPMFLGCGLAATGAWLLHGAAPLSPGDTAFASSALPMTAPAGHRDDSDPELARARVQAQIAMFDARFAAEPVDADWASNEERALRTFFSADLMQAQGLRPPQRIETICHSNTCRISARYVDPEAAELATQRFAAHVADRLPFGAVLPQALGDGSIQIDAWYSTTRI